jgi:hypothetical protein
MFRIITWRSGYCDRFYRFWMNKVSVISFSTAVGKTGLLQLGNQLANLERQSITIRLILI